MPGKKSHYDTLGVPRDASTEVIRKAYKKKAAAAHPDRNPGDSAAEEEFKQIGKALSVLTNPDKRRRYDETGADGPNRDVGVAESLAPIFIAVLAESIDAGRELKYVDIIQKMTAKMRELQDQAKNYHRTAKSAFARLKSAEGRLKEPDSVLGDLLQKQIDRVSGDVNGAEAKLSAFSEAISYLKKCKYEVEKDPSAFGDMRFVFAG